MINWNSLPGKIITVISDLHSNKRAVKAAMEAVKNRRTDQLIILGDIFTYGIDVQEVTEMVNQAIEEGAWLLMGNHDEMYLDLIHGQCPMYHKLRPDLQESIDYNLNKLDIKQFVSWPWQKQIIHNDIFFSHANPYGDLWGYIKDIYDFQEAAKKIKNMGHLAGIFGHTHRAAYFGLKNSFLTEVNGLQDDIFVFNPGSVGQPRSIPRQVSILRLSLHENKLWAEIEPIQYDMPDHLKNLMSSTLSNQTKIILSSFFVG